jgi:NAD(P)-dependent dehydrogenase (short-subunit alcohol dehydrogenase family)
MSTESLLVTGAGSGIGRAVVARALQTGHKIIATDRDEAALQAAWADSPAHLIAMDVSDEAAVAQGFSHAESVLGGPVRMVVHCAGVYEIEPTESLSLANWQRLLSVNATGSFLVARECGRRLLEQGGQGSLVLVSSIAGDHGDDHEPASHYATSKATISGLTRQLAVEWGSRGIRVNCVAPGLIRSPMLRITDDPDRAESFVREVVPAGRLGEPDDVAAACLFLVGPQASYISGAVLVVDGGLTAR